MDRRTILRSSAALFMGTIGTTVQARGLRSNPATLPPTVGFSHLSEGDGRLVWISGQVPRTPDGALVGPGDFVAQLEQVFRNLDIAVREAGGRWSDVVKLNYYCDQRVERALLGHVNRVRDQYVDRQRPPASTFVFVAGLALAQWLIEIEAVLSLPEPGDGLAVHATLAGQRPISRQLLSAARTMGAATRAEAGCLDYRMAVDVERPEVLILVERWRDEAALRAHFQTPHMQEFRAALRSEGGIETGMQVFAMKAEIPFRL